jgi:hypothetical protein
MADMNDFGCVVTVRSLGGAAPVIPVERQEAYCRDLLKILIRYSDATDIAALTRVIEQQVRNRLERRYSPGLNAARYDLYRRYWLHSKTTQTSGLEVCHD